MISDVPGTLPGGSTAMVEGLYRAWDELRSVPTGSQSGLRVIVLFTDGASNSVPGDYGYWPRRRAPDVRLPAESRRHARPDLEQPAHHGAVRHANRRQQHGHRYHRSVGLHQHAVQRQQRVAEVHAGRERAHASSQRRHSDVISAADGVAQRGRRAAVEHARPEGLRHRRRQSIRPRSTTSTTPRATSWRSSPTRRETTPATTRSASTRSAWGSSCRCCWARGRSRRRAS